MTVLAEKPLGNNQKGSRVPGADRASAELFAKIFQAYQQAWETVKDVIETMVHILNDPSADREEQDAAVDTLIEALFPSHKDKEYGADLFTLKAGDGVNVEHIIARHEKQEDRFANTVKALMKKQRMTQRQLADAIGVTQPAIAMLLSRKCRPQKATVVKIAQALGVASKALWTE